MFQHHNGYGGPQNRTFCYQHKLSGSLDLSSQEEASEQKLSYSRCKQALISNLTAWLTAVKNQVQSAGYAVEGSLSEQQIITDNR